MNLRTLFSWPLRLLADLGTPARASAQRKTDEAKAWTDPNGEVTRVEQVDDRGTATRPQDDFDAAYWSRIPKQWRRS